MVLLLDLDVLQVEAHPHQYVLDDLPVVTLEEDLLVLGRAPAGAFRLQGGCEFIQTYLLRIYTVDDGVFLSPFPKLDPNPYPLGLLAHLLTNAEICWQATDGTNFCHYYPMKHPWY